LLTGFILSLQGTVSLSTFEKQIHSCCELLETLWLSQNNSSLQQVKTEMRFYASHKRRIEINGLPSGSHLKNDKFRMSLCKHIYPSVFMAYVVLLKLYI